MRLEGKMLPHEAEGFPQASATLFFSMCHECVTALESRGSALTLGSAGLGVPCGTSSCVVLFRSLGTEASSLWRGGGLRLTHCGARRLRAEALSSPAPDRGQLALVLAIHSFLKGKMRVVGVSASQGLHEP